MPIDKPAKYEILQLEAFVMLRDNRSLKFGETLGISSCDRVATIFLPHIYIVKCQTDRHFLKIINS